MDQWITDLVVAQPTGLHWSTLRRMTILARWPDAMVRAAEQDARLGKPAELARYDAEVAAIKLAIPKV